MRLFFLVLLIQGTGLYAQFSDAFSDGNFLEDPEWVGASDWFVVDADQQALRLNAPAEAGEAFLFTASNSMEAATWQFSFHLGFNPSSVNYAQVYLAADGADVAQIHQSFYLVLGTSDDNISLWQLRNGEKELLIAGVADRLNMGAPEGSIRVTRHRGGLMVLESNMGDGWLEEGRADDTEGFSSEWFGLSCHYTATRSALFWFTEFLVEGEVYMDTIPSKVEAFEVVDMRTIRLDFSREIIAETFNVQSFYWKEDGPAIASVSWDGPLTVNIYLAEDFPNGRLLQAGLHAVLGANGAPVEGAEFELYFYKTQRYDLIISEVMADPLPSIGLVGTQYLEIYNRSEQAINVSGFTLEVELKREDLGKYILFPGDYLLLVPSGQVEDWNTIDNHLALPLWPSLPVSEGEVVIRDNYGDVIAASHYHRKMGEEGFKQEGGWSLEVKDLNNLSGDWANWYYCSDLKGGTPGGENSVASAFPDVVNPSIESVYLKSDSCLVLRFTEPLDEYFLAGLEKSGISPSGLFIQSLMLTEPHQASLEVCFTTIIPENRGYEIAFVNLPVDLAGNQVVIDRAVQFARPVVARPSDVVINELMFDPPEGGSDFVELYNRSKNHIDLSEIFLSRGNEAGIPESLVLVSTEKRALFPGEYLVLTGNKEWITQTYNVTEERGVLLLGGMPNYINSGGTVIMSDKSASILDVLTYSETMHYQLLSTTKGVSLERIDANAATQEVFNWHSASADHGYATPGRKNSQSVLPASVESETFIFLESEVFTPNQDGIDDLLLVHYEFEKPGYSCSVTIYNRAGQPVRCLVNNELAGTRGFYSWDGLNENNTRCSTGLYVVLVRCFHPSGQVKEAKKVAVLGL